MRKDVGCLIIFLIICLIGGDLTGACADAKLAASLGHTESAEWVVSDCS
jgi:hypothetical protein|tara:strand:- start:38 stop:184 length:147 start_codon:yes stop_codon:yes gene_type:complete